MVLCVLLGFVILIQNPKGGGLSSSIGGFSNQTMGVQRTTESLEKASWYLMGVIAFLVLLTGTSLLSPSPSDASPGQTQEINGDLNKTYPGEPKVPTAPQSTAPVPGTAPAPGATPQPQQQVVPAPQPEAAPAPTPAPDAPADDTKQ